MKDKKLQTKKAYLLLGFAMALIVVMLLRMNEDVSSLDTHLFSLSDAMLFSMGSYCYGLSLVPFLLIAIVYALKNDFLNSRVLLYPSKRALWVMQEKKIFLISIFYITFFLLVVFSFGVLRHYVWFNWGEAESYYFVKNHDIFYGDFAQVWVSAFFLGMIRNMIFGNLVLLSKWGTKRTIYGVIVAFIVCICEIILSGAIRSLMLFGIKKIRIIMSLFEVNYKMFQSDGERIFMVVWALIIGTFFVMVFYMLRRKKEFFDDLVF
ncbi:MAG: hypothetical protein PHD56_00700 [Anaerostipes sp.]|nr:hypothetical protein [Anaerostipes sp.]